MLKRATASLFYDWLQHFSTHINIFGEYTPKNSTEGIILVLCFSFVLQEWSLYVKLIISAFRPSTCTFLVPNMYIERIYHSLELAGHTRTFREENYLINQICFLPDWTSSSFHIQNDQPADQFWLMVSAHTVHPVNHVYQINFKVIIIMLNDKHGTFTYKYVH